MKVSSTSERLSQLMSERGLRQVDILEAAKPYSDSLGEKFKLTKSDLSQYVGGKHVPMSEKLAILGLALGVNEAWLQGYDVPMGRSVTPITQDGDGRLSEIIELCKLLSAKQQDFVIHVVKGILSGQ